MAPQSTALTTKVESGSPYQLDKSQTLRASTALLKKIQTDEAARRASSGKADLLADNDDDDDNDEADADAVPIWLVMTTKKHVVDQKKMKPGKIALPHPLASAASPSLRICLITADPQRKYKDLVADARFPAQLSAKVARVIGITKLKAKYKSYESRRQLYGEYDVFLADDRIVTYLPATLGKIFYDKTAKRPVPVSLQGKPANGGRDEAGAKRIKLADGGTKAVKAEPRPEDVAREIERAVGAALVHLSPSTNTAVKVGKSGWSAEHVCANIDAVVSALVDRYVTTGWRNVRGFHIKGPNTASLPIWLAEELWEDEADVLEKAPPAKIAGQAKKDKKKRKRALTEGAKVDEAEQTGAAAAASAAAAPKKRKSLDGGADAGESSKKAKTESDGGAAKAARKALLRQQKEDARKTVAV
ncbi:hypothetical protein MBLNU459_g8033t1 [Dothideomycetes sp. NU459]